MNELAQRQLVIENALSFLGTPFHENCCIKGVGTDCGRFLAKVYGDSGIKVPDLKDISLFPHNWHLHRDDERYLNLMLKFSKITNDPKPADMCFFRVGRGWAHSAIIIQYPLVIHAMPPCVSKTNADQIVHVTKNVRLFLTPWGI
jgi:cell wall-associated NlpC family hydrolase